MPTTLTKRMRPKSRSTAVGGTGRSLFRGLGRLALGVGLTSLILVSLVGLCALMMPVTVLTRNLNLGPSVVAVYGSLREGRADLEGGYQLDWTTGLGLLHLATPVTLTGPDTRINATLLSGPTGIRLDGADGRAGPGLAQLVPGAWTCDMTARITDVGFAWTWTRASATGEVATPEGTCRKDGRELAVPPLNLRLGSDGRDAVATLSANETPPMADLRLRRDRVIDIAIRPEAADVFPQLPRGGPFNLQLPF